MRTHRTSRIPKLTGALGAATALSLAGAGGAVLAAPSAFASPSAHHTAVESTGVLGSRGPVSLSVTAPTPGTVVTGSSLSLSVYAHGYYLDSGYAGTPTSSWIGHYHEVLDGNLVDMTPLHGPNQDTISMVGVTPGPHTLTLVPTNNDHSMVMSAAVNVPFTYAGPYLPLPAPQTFTGAATIAITAPANGTRVSGTSFTLGSSVTNFQLCGDCYAKDLVAGVGHWHIFADQIAMSHMLTMASGPTQEVSLKGLEPGWHTFYAVLVDNHHMPFMTMGGGLQPSTVTSVKLYVQPSEDGGRAGHWAAGVR